MQVGAAGKKAALFSFILVQVATVLPTSSSLGSHEYVALSPIEVPVKVTCPLTGSMGLLHRAINIGIQEIQFFEPLGPI